MEYIKILKVVIAGLQEIFILLFIYFFFFYFLKLLQILTNVKSALSENN